MHKMKGKKSTVPFIWFLINIYGMMATSIANITWTKYRFESTTEEICIPDETRFIKNDVFDVLTCSQYCYEDNECLSISFHTENRQCIGCQIFVKDALTKQTSKGYVYFSKRQLQIDCKEIMVKENSGQSGVYKIMLRNLETLQVYCDMETDGGGWTVFQNSFIGSLDFHKDFSAYENGFGDVNGEIWLGLKHIQELTETQSEVRYYLTVVGGQGKMIEKYTGFKLLGSRYTLSIDVEPLQRDGFSLPLVKFFFADFNGSDFSTMDRDSLNGCANKYGAGWWYAEHRCEYMLNLNNMYGKSVKDTDDSPLQLSHALKVSRMMFRRI